MTDHEIRVTIRHKDDPEDALSARLKADPGPVTWLDTDVLEDGRCEFTAGLDTVPAGHVKHVLAKDYPRIVGSLMAQGARVKFDSILTLVSNWEVDE